MYLAVLNQIQNEYDITFDNATNTINIINTTDKTQVFNGVEYLPENYSNNDITYLLNGLAINDELEPGQNVTFTITFFYRNNTLASNNTLNSIINFDFSEKQSNILKDMIASDMFPHVRLTSIYRQSENSFIPILASEIKNTDITSNIEEKKEKTLTFCKKVSVLCSTGCGTRTHTLFGNSILSRARLPFRQAGAVGDEIKTRLPRGVKRKGKLCHGK